jgi:RHS repeat-associated protein
VLQEPPHASFLAASRNRSASGFPSSFASGFFASGAKKSRRGSARFSRQARRVFFAQVAATASGKSGRGCETASGQPFYAKENPIRFSGKYYDSETGLSYYGYRYYSASLGRFINRDLLEERGAWNLYSGLKQSANDPYANVFGTQATNWSIEWEQAQDRLLSNTSLPHTTQSITFEGKENSGLPGASEGNQKTYSANATGHYPQGGAEGAGSKQPSASGGNPAAGNTDINLYIYAGNNPVNSFDALGLANFYHRGHIIGNDGVDDNRALVIKTTQKSFKNGRDTIKGANLSRSDVRKTVAFIEENNGNTEAFKKDGIAYKNSIEIVGSESNRQKMVDIVSQDNGKGGTGAANNQEHGGSINSNGKDGVVIAARSGKPADPSKDDGAHIRLPNAPITFHSHPSGTTESENNGSGIGRLRSPQEESASFAQPPSKKDIEAAGTIGSIGGGSVGPAGGAHYVFGRGDGNVYIYNSSGVQAVMPIADFVNLGKK